jgi:hypothetical protein
VNTGVRSNFGNQAAPRIEEFSVSLPSFLRGGAAAVALTVTVGGALVVGAGVSNAGNAVTGGSGRTLTASLVGANEVPAGAGSRVGSGEATFTINPGRGEICYNLAFSQDLGKVVAGHIHKARAGVSGPIVVPFTITGNPTTGCQAISRGLAVDIITDPSGYYANFHTSTYPKGAVRGQLSK